MSYKRLEKGRFRWPPAAGGETRVVLSHEELALLVGGIDLVAARPRRGTESDYFRRKEL